ncbi:MAG: bifunctional oligoribonuclease/PAP phosphatase NrnA [Armatimonadetes bacterium]|nr:bifunctional oligoribonuclease/PAP phosphatase NrnA [Armatimonadota bacterium]
MNPRAAIAATLKSSSNVLITCHLGPDGDCLGAGLALALALRRLGKSVTVASADGVPASLRFLPGADQVVTAIPDGSTFDVAVTMECSSVDRIGTVAPAVMRARSVVAIDHHAAHAPYADLTDWDPRAAAVGEQVDDLIKHLGVPLDRPMALALLTAVVTDTGVFRFGNTTGQVLRLAADLMDHGVTVEEVVRAVYEDQPAAAVRLLGAALAALELHEGGAVATTAITAAMLAATGASPAEVSGVVSAMRTIAGVRLAMVFEERDGTVRVSIRSRDGVRADRVAEALGGGGHAAAAGAEVPGGLDETRRRAVEAARREISTSHAAR